MGLLKITVLLLLMIFFWQISHVRVFLRKISFSPLSQAVFERSCLFQTHSRIIHFLSHTKITNFSSSPRSHSELNVISLNFCLLPAIISSTKIILIYYFNFSQATELFYILSLLPLAGSVRLECVYYFHKVIFEYKSDNTNADGFCIKKIIKKHIKIIKINSSSSLL